MNACIRLLSEQNNDKCDVLTLIPGWIGNYVDYKVWDENNEITFPFPNCNDATVQLLHISIRTCRIKNTENMNINIG